MNLKEIMEIENYERDFKTTSEHWDIILNYPTLLKQKFGGFDGDNAKIKEMWEEMIGILNSLGYGQRSVQKWKEAIGRWKSKVKAKARRRTQEMTATGGGPVKTVSLTQTEEKLIAIIGWKCVTGDSNKELGLSTATATIDQSINNTIMEPSPSPSQRINIPSCTSVHPPKTTKIILESATTRQSEPKEIAQSLSLNVNDNLNTKRMISKEDKSISSTLPGPSTAASQCLEATLLIEPPPLVPLMPKKRTTSRDKENSLMQNKKKKLITSSDKSQRYMTLTTMHREQINMLGNINQNIKNNVDNLKEIASDINRLANFIISKKKK